ncbi:unnamed protein product [Discula destructiva]
MTTNSPAASHQSAASSTRGSVSSQERQSTGSTIPDPLSVEDYGRLFNAYREGKYLLPNDGDEQDRLDLQHHQWRLILDGKLYIAPIGEPGQVLDIGTGTGIWAKQFAKQHPNSQVIGTDISLIQPTEALPPNLSFVREDSEELWVFDKPSGFDYIRWRLMFSCFNDFEAMFAKVLEHLKPGGWAEFHESSLELVPADEAAAVVLRNSTLQKCFDLMLQAGINMGRDFDAPRKFKRWMIEAGFEDVIEKQILVPVNPWPLDRRDKYLGKWFCLNLLRFTDNLPKLLGTAGVPAAEIPALQEGFRADLIWPQMRVYTPQYVIYGRKPLGKDQIRSAEPPAQGIKPEIPSSVLPPDHGIESETQTSDGLGSIAMGTQPQAVYGQPFGPAQSLGASPAPSAKDFSGSKRKKPAEA